MASWGSIPCGVAFFGDDPRPNLPKLCSCLHSLPWQLGKIHSQKKVIHRHSIHKIAFFFSSWIFGWGSRSFFWTSRISGRVSLQNLQNLRPESLVDGLNETISRTDTFLVTPFLDANKKGPKVGQRLWLYHKSYPEMWIFCTLKSITYKMTTMLRVESQPF